MNQILSTESVNNKYKGSKKSSGPKDIKSVTKFFAFGLLIFGIFLIINSSYAMIKTDGDKKAKADVGEPTIEIEEKGEDKVLIKVMHEDDVATLTYSFAASMNSVELSFFDFFNTIIHVAIDVP